MGIIVFLHFSYPFFRLMIKRYFSITKMHVDRFYSFSGSWGVPSWRVWRHDNTLPSTLDKLVGKNRVYVERKRDLWESRSEILGKPDLLE